MYKELRTSQTREGRNKEPARRKKEQPAAGVSDGPIASLASVRARRRTRRGKASLAAGADR